MSQVSGFEQSPEWPSKELLRENSGGNQSKSSGSNAERASDWLERVKEIEGSIVTGFQLCTLNGMYVCVCVCLVI